MKFREFLEKYGAHTAEKVAIVAGLSSTTGKSAVILNFFTTCCKGELAVVIEEPVARALFEHLGNCFASIEKTRAEVMPATEGMTKQ